MSTGHQRRAVCQSCGQRCRVTPLEVMLRGGTGWRGHWVWSYRTLCPVCQLHLVELLGELELQDEESWATPALDSGVAGAGIRRGGELLTA